MMRVLFIDAADPVSKLNQRFAPLWPAYLAAHLETRIGSNRFEFRLSNGRVENELKSFKPHVVAISSVTMNYNHAMEYARIVKKTGLPVVIGGIHISFMPHSLTKEMDVGCIGEGEETFAELMRLYLDSGEFNHNNLATINGVIYRNDGKLISTPRRPLIASIDHISHPKRALLGFRNTDTMMTARGCPYRCVFCSVSRYWKKVRFASPDFVIDEITELVKNGVRIIKIYDDLFTCNQKRLEQIAERIQSSGLYRRVKFACWCRANTVTQEVTDALKKMNVVSVELGLESGCDRILRYLKGNVSLNENYKAIELLKNAGIQTNAAFIIGSPDETEDEIMQTYDFIKKSRLDTVTVNPLIPFPGTPIWEYASDKGLVSEDMEWGQIGRIVISEKLSAAQLHRILKKFKRLCLIKRLRALPKSPWLQEAPKIGWKRLITKFLR
ncbi:MAG: radical SAM protein [Thermodesulfobacteriota bacterium]|nr:radical SAM protein [Thermodesulfobacteriota bacterium]